MINVGVHSQGIHPVPKGPLFLALSWSRIQMHADDSEQKESGTTLNHAAIVPWILHFLWTGKKKKLFLANVPFVSFS